MNQQSPNNILPKELQEWLKKEKSQTLLIDVREHDEVSFAPFPSKVVHLPLSQSSSWINSLPEIFSIPEDRQVVVICHSGIRSRNFGAWLIEQGWVQEVWNLQGGIDLWSVDIDSSVPRY